MTQMYEIRADYDQNSIVVYQAYNTAIAKAAIEHQTFVAPFSFNRMTWIKPSFRWMMHRSNWGQKKGQEHTLRIRIKRSGWEKALSKGVLTSPDGAVFSDATKWKRDFDKAAVHVQWDTERSIRGAALDHYSIQVGLSRHIIKQFASEWIIAIEDFSPTVAKAHKLIRAGNTKQATRLFPSERPYPIEDATMNRLSMKTA